MVTKPIRVVVADDHPVVRRGICDTINDEADMAVVGEGASADDAIKLASEQSPNVVVLDVNMPGDGLSAAKKIATAFPEVGIAMLTICDDFTSVNAALQAGACAYLTKGSAGDELVTVIRKVARRERYVSPELAARLLAAPEEVADTPSSDATAELTERERQIFELLGQGLSNNQIGERLGLKLNTVKHYLTPLMQKLGARNRVEVALIARGVKKG